MTTRAEEWATVTKDAHVHKAMTAVQADLSKVGVGKLGDNRQQGFKFRAWDDVQQTLSPILAEHKLLVIPNVRERTQTEHSTKSGGIQFKVVLTGEVVFKSGVDGSEFRYGAVGEGMDSGDKATSKALTMMVKYALLHGLQIPLQGVQDADAQTPEESKPITPTSGLWESMDEDEQRFLQGIADKAMTMTPAEAVAYIKGEKLTAEEQSALWTRFDSKTRAAMKKAAKETT